MTEYEAVIGLEVHVQLNTHSKLFTKTPYCYGKEPNTYVDPVVLGLPGSLPVLNKAAIFKTIQAGLAFHCEIARKCKWDRKNYFYPDAPKNYQISQFDQPLCKGGYVEIELEGPARNIQGQHRKVALNRIHLEEDVGKLTHYGQESWIDYNRAGVPLIEIVSEPDMHSVAEVFAYLKSLVMHLQYIQVSNCDMEKGQMRCDANISIRPKGTTTLGTKVELKNLNSISGVCNGVQHEIYRQTALLNQGEVIEQETRRWDADKNESYTMRSKEDAHDYRYFTDPDLCPISLSEEVIAAQKIPEMPFQKQERYLADFALPYTVTSVICPEKHLSDFFESTLKIYDKSPLAVANWIANDLLRELSGKSIHEVWETLKITPNHVAELVKLIDDNILSKQSAKEVFVDMMQSGEMPSVIVKNKGLQISVDLDGLEKICASVIESFPKPVAEYRSGKEKAINVLKGQVMKQTQGKAPIQEIDRLLKQLLSK